MYKNHKINYLYHKFGQNISNQNIWKINIQPALFYWLFGEYFHRTKNGAHKPLKALKNVFLTREVILRYLSFIALTHWDHWQVSFAGIPGKN